jgi:protein-tyrosine phosphatase
MDDLIAANSKNTALLFTSGLVESPRAIRAHMAENTVDASMFGDRPLNLRAPQYPNIPEAMTGALPLKESTCTAWQFWSWYSPERAAWTPLEHLRATLETQAAPANHMVHTVKTSITHPLRIDSVSIPNVSGRIGLTFCPGKHTEGLYGGTWERDLALDLESIKAWAWGGHTLVSLMEAQEFDLLGVPDFLTLLPKEKALNWLHLPIQDMQIPDEQFESSWAKIAPQLHHQLNNGESIVIHCRGGLGRTGLLAARILGETGIAPVQAVATVRQARERSIETYSQELYILTQAWEQTRQTHKE